MVVFMAVNGSLKRESTCFAAVAKKSRLSENYPSYFVAYNPESIVPILSLLATGTSFTGFTVTVTVP